VHEAEVLAVAGVVEPISYEGFEAGVLILGDALALGLDFGFEGFDLGFEVRQLAALRFVDELCASGVDLLR
jgi:hypothetical protein